MKNHENPPRSKPPVTDQEKAVKRRSFLLETVGVLLTLAAFSGGLLWNGGYVRPHDLMATCQPLFWFWLIALSAAALLIWGINELLSTLFFRRLNRMNVAEVQNYMITHRETAEQNFHSMMRSLRLVRFMAAVQTILIAALGLGIAFLSGAAAGSTTLRAAFILLFLCAALFLVRIAMLRIPYNIPKDFFREDESYVSPAAFPVLYEIANRARETIGCPGKVHICLDAGNNIGAADFSGDYSIQIGAMLLNLLTEEELYAVLLHEFTHIKGTKYDSKTELRYQNWLSYGRPDNRMTAISSHMFACWDTLYSFDSTIWRMSTSVLVESEADRAMARCHDRRIAGSALIKTYYMTMFDWEDELRPYRNSFRFEDFREISLNERLEDCCQVVTRRAPVWNEILPHQILGRSDSHPTPAMRLDALGLTVEECRPTDTLCGDPCHADYAAERRRVVDFLDHQIHEHLEKEDYAAIRKERYETPLAEVEKWEQAGKPLTNDGYRDVVENLATLGRMEEADELCRRAAAECPPSAAHYAQFRIGRRLLHELNPEGIEWIYRAMDYNHNYVEDGLSEIGWFCCLTGNQAELDRYREKCPDLLQFEKDVYGDIFRISRHDNLSAERELPREQLDEILSVIRSVGQGIINRVFMIRKTVSADFFATVVVVEFVKGTDDEKQGEVFHQIFNCLDTVSDWQFSLLDYDECKSVKPESIEGSLVYDRAAETGEN